MSRTGQRKASVGEAFYFLVFLLHMSVGPFVGSFASPGAKGESFLVVRRIYLSLVYCAPGLELWVDGGDNERLWN